MTARTSDVGPAQAADALVREHYGPLKAEILRALTRRMRAEGISLPAQDLEAAYNEAWHGITQRILDGNPVTSVPGLLFTITHRRALDAFRRRHESQTSDVDLDLYAVEVDLAAHLDDRAKLGRLFTRLGARLNDKERRAVTLCLLYGYSRPEAAAMLGMSKASFERLMDRASRKVGDVVAGIEARGCGDEEWTTLMRDYAMGVISEGDRDHQRARAHLAEPRGCVACGRYVRGLRGLAGTVPPALLAPGHGTLAAALRRLLAGHWHRGGVADTAQAASVGSAGTVGTTGFLSPALAGSATKLTAIAGATFLLAAGAARVADHSGRPDRRAIMHSTTHAASTASASGDALVSRPEPALGLPDLKNATARRSRRKGRGSRETGTVAGEFSFERHTEAREPSAPATSYSATYAPPATAHGEGSGGDFGFEE